MAGLKEVRLLEDRYYRMRDALAYVITVMEPKNPAEEIALEKCRQAIGLPTKQEIPSHEQIS